MRHLALTLLTFSSIAFGQLAPGDEQSREWTQNDAPNGMTITNRDRYVDYSRNGKVVLRVIRRTSVLGTASGDYKMKEPPVEQHHLEFVVNGNVVATVFMKAGEAPNFELSSGEGVYFASGYAGSTLEKRMERRYFYLSIPKLDYFEYVEAAGADVSFPARDYDAMKRGFFQATARGSMHPLGKERNLKSEK